MLDSNQLRTELMRIKDLLQLGVLEKCDHELLLQILSTPIGVELYVNLAFQEVMLQELSISNPCDRILPLNNMESISLLLAAPSNTSLKENDTPNVAEINGLPVIHDAANSQNKQRLNFSLSRVGSGLLLVCLGILVPYAWSTIEISHLNQKLKSVDTVKNVAGAQVTQDQVIPSTTGIKNTNEPSAKINHYDDNELPEFSLKHNLGHEIPEIRVCANMHADYHKYGPESVGSLVSLDEQFSLRKGDVELEFPLGVKTIITGPAIFKVLSAKRLEIKFGKCSVYAPSLGVGFEVLTPSSMVKDLGTRFEVVVNDYGESDVYVIEGQVKVIRQKPESQTPYLINSGEAVRFTKPEHETPINIPFSSNTYKSRLGDRVISYSALPADAARINRLESLEVLRNGKVHRYLAQELIGCEVSSYCTGEVDFMACFISPVGSDLTPKQLLAHDLLLNTGIVNSGGSYYPLESPPVINDLVLNNKLPNSLQALPVDSIKSTNIVKTTPGMKLKFYQPVYNSKGPDIVIFEVQKTIGRPQGDRFHLSPMNFRQGLRGITLDEFDLWTTSPGLKKVENFMVEMGTRNFSDLNELLSFVPQYKYDVCDFYALPVAVDLSSMGFHDGELVEELFLQDTLDDRERIDPVFIGGLPRIVNPKD